MDRAEIKIFLTFFFIYSFFIHWVGHSENSRFFLTRAIVDESRLEIDSYYNQTGDRSYYNGHYYSDKNPGTSFLALPTYVILKAAYSLFDYTEINNSTYLTRFFGENKVPVYDYINLDHFTLMSMCFITIFTSSLFGALLVVIFYKCLKFYVRKENTKIISTFFFGLGTLIFPYSTVFLEFVPATFFAFLPFYLLSLKKVNDKAIFFAGLSLGFAITISILSLVALAGYLIYFLKLKKRFILFFIGIILGLLPLLMYNYIVFKDPLTLPVFHLDPIIWKNPFPTKDRIVNCISIKSIIFILRALFYPINGFFYYYPVFLFSFFGSYHLLQKKIMVLETILTLIIFFFFVSLIGLMFIPSVWAGAFFGPRNFTLLVPFLALPLAYLFEKGDKKLKVLLMIFFVYSVFLNFTSLQPKKDFLIDETSTRIKAEYEEKLHNSLDIILDPIREYYLPLFFSNGVRSRLFEDIINGLMPDIRFLIPEKREFFHLFYFHIPFLCLLPIILVYIVIWWSDIFTKERKRIISENRWKILIALFAFTLFVGVLFLNSLPKELSYHKGWFPPEKGERWMGTEGSLVIYNKNPEIPVALTFYARSYIEDRNIQFYLNDVFIENFTVYTILSKITTHQINLKPGLNIFKFVSLNGCDIPNILEGINDYRCLSIGLFNVSLNPITRNQTIILKQNFYLPEGNVSWMKQDGKILIFNFENETQNAIIQLNLKSFNTERSATLSLNDQMIDNFTIFEEGSRVNILLTLKEGENVLTLHSMENCTIVDTIAKNKDFRCISIGIIDISILPEKEIKNQTLTFIFNKGWYLGLEEGNLISMKNKSNLLIINNEDYPSTKIISIYLKSFNKDREIKIIFNEKNIWQFSAFKESKYVDLLLNFHPGVNNLEFLSDTCDFPSKLEDKRCISLSIGDIEIKDVNTSGIFILPFVNWYNKELQEEARWMKQDGKILIFNFENETQNVKIKFNLKSLYVDRSVTLYLNNQPVDNFMVFKEGSTVYTPLLTLKEGENVLTLHSMENCTIVDTITKNKDFRCISVGLINISILSFEEIKNHNLTVIFNKNWYDKNLLEEERWMNNNATISVFNFKNEIQYTTFYFYFVPFYGKKTIHFILNDKEENIFEIALESGEVYTKQLPINPGENILRFYSEEECMEISKIEKNDDHRCVSVSLRYIKFN